MVNGSEILKHIEEDAPVRTSIRNGFLGSVQSDDCKWVTDGHIILLKTEVKPARLKPMLAKQRDRYFRLRSDEDIDAIIESSNRDLTPLTLQYISWSEKGISFAKFFLYDQAVYLGAHKVAYIVSILKDEVQFFMEEGAPYNAVSIYAGDKFTGLIMPVQNVEKLSTEREAS